MQIPLSATLLPAMIVCLVVAAALLILAVLLSRPRRRPPKPVSRGAHDARSNAGTWLERIDSIVARHHAGELSREEAFAELARVAREFASRQTGRDLGATTLHDLNGYPHDSGTNGPQGYTLLRQTIAALYPPEFADAEFNSHAREASVEQAAEWVSNLVERWRR